MKKYAWLAVVAVLALSSVAAGAPKVINDAPKDGKIVTEYDAVLIDTSSYYADKDAPRTITSEEMQVGNQTAKVRVPVEALLPCYLELTFQGNDMNVLEQSFGKGASVDWGGAGNYVGFYPSVGGFVDGNWAPINNSTSLNAEVKPMPAGETVKANQTFLRACDTFRAEAFSNLSYTFNVNVDNGGLTRVGGNEVLPIEIRYQSFIDQADPGFAGVTGWSEAQELAATDLKLIDADALQHSVVYQQFRVPYSQEFQAGTYKSNITWTLATP